MIASDLVEYLTTIGKIGGIIAGLVITFGVLAKSPLGKAARWVYVRLVGEPVGQWFRHQVRTAATQVVDEKLLKRNGGTTIPDVNARLDVLATQVELNHQETVVNHRANTARLDAIEQKIGERT